MKNKELKEILEQVKKVNELSDNILEKLRKEIFSEEIEGEIISILDKENKELSLDDIAIQIWIDRGGLELKNNEDYYRNEEFFNLQNIVRNVIFDSLTQKGYLDVIRKKETQEVQKMFFKKKVIIKKTKK